MHALANVGSDPTCGRGSNLEPNHTHFLLVDSGAEGAKAWGGEIALRVAIETEYCRSRRVPRVLLVVQGGPGTLSTVLAAIESQCPVVLIADSGGVAELLHIFLKEYQNTSSINYKRGLVPPKFQAQFEPKMDILVRIAEMDMVDHKVRSAPQGSTGPISLLG